MANQHDAVQIEKEGNKQMVNSKVGTRKELRGKEVLMVNKVVRVLPILSVYPLHPFPGSQVN